MTTKSEKLDKLFLTEIDNVNKSLTIQQREQLILNWLVEGLSTEDIAKLLHIQPELINQITNYAIENYKPDWVN
tara:strand:+ start:1182 stop:1403 length:222 start_codon:yes stop_codon:yes gene_type:complete